MNLSEIFIRRPIMTTLVMIAILFFGAVAYQKLPVSDLPNIDYPSITVSVSYPGANPETMANNVVAPLEREFMTIQGLQMMASSSETGDATIVLQFSLRRTIDSCAQDVQAAINVAMPQLPQDLPYAPTYSKVNPSQTPILYFAVTSHTMPLYNLYEYAYNFIGERLSTIDGVAQVVVYGEPFAVRVQFDPQKLAAKSIGIDELATAIQNQNVYLPTGTLFGKNTEFTINAQGQLTAAEMYDQIIIKNDQGAIVRIADIGKSLDSLYEDKEFYSYYTPNMQVPAVVFGIQTQPGVNSMQVISDINTILPKLEQNLPGSVKLHRLFDKSEFIQESVDDVEMTLLIALGLVVFVIFVYLGKAIETIIPALTLPMTIMGTFALMSIFGYSIDILSLLAITLSIGFLVDDAIVVLENIVRRVEKGETVYDAALNGSKQIGFTIFSMTLSLSAVFIPLLFMGGVIGLLFHEFAVVIVCAMLLSGFISLSLTPMLCSRFIVPYIKGQETRIEKFSHRLNDFLLKAYDKSLQFVLAHQKTTLLFGFTSLVASVTLLRLLPTDFLPPDDIGFIVIHSQASDGTSPFKMIDYQKQISKIAQKNPSLESMVSLGAIPNDNKGIIFFRLKPYKERPPIDTVLNTLHSELKNLPGVASYLKTLPLIDLQVSTSDINAPYQYTLQGLYDQDLYACAAKMLEKIKTTPGFKQVSTDLELKQPQLNLKILRDRASVLNISALAVENALSLAYGAINLSPINEATDQYYVILETLPKFYRDPSVLSQLYLRSSTGGLVPFKAVTEASETVGPLMINRLNGLPAVNIFFDLDNVPLGTAISRLEKISQEILPSTVTGQVQGTADVFKASFENLNFLLMITVFIIYIILGILYENFLHPVTVMSTLPPAALGGLLVLYLFNIPLSLYAFVGFILLLGIVLKNGIILVDFANEAILAGKTPLEAITAACHTRFRPILMTSLSAIMGAIPVALGIGGMTALSRRPLGVVIVSGLIVSQILTLYLTPVTYLLLETLREKVHARSKK